MTGEPDLRRVLQAIRARHDGLLCVPLGRRGAMMHEGNQLHSVAGFEVDAADTTGAGDVFRGALIHSLLRGDGPADMLAFANAAAALSCTRPGAIGGIPSLEETLRFQALTRTEPLA